MRRDSERDEVSELNGGYAEWVPWLPGLPVATAMWAPFPPSFVSILGGPRR